MLPDDSQVDAALRAVCAAARVTRLVQSTLTPAGGMRKADASVVTIGDYAAQGVAARTLNALLGPVTLVGEESAAHLREAEGGSALRAAVEVVRRAGVWAEADEASLLEAIDLGSPGPGAPLPRAFWTIDPIDGTKGFVQGRQYAVCLAKIEDGAVTVAALCCPNLSIHAGRPYNEPDAEGSTYIAGRGMGCFAMAGIDPAGRAVRLARREGDLCERPVITYSLEPSEARAAHFGRLSEALGTTGQPAALDSQCKYAVVARGEADCYYRPPRRAHAENIWDHASGCLMLEEVGCVVTDVDGRELDFSRARMEGNRGILAAPRRLHERIVRTLGELAGS